MRARPVAVCQGCELSAIVLCMFENFTATDRWTKKPVHCVYQAMIVAIATRHADAVDIKFLVDGRKVWVALPHPAWVEYKKRTGKMITDSLAAGDCGALSEDRSGSGRRLGTRDVFVDGGRDAGAPGRGCGGDAGAAGVECGADAPPAKCTFVVAGRRASPWRDSRGGCLHMFRSKSQLLLCIRRRRGASRRKFLPLCLRPRPRPGFAA